MCSFIDSSMINAFFFIVYMLKTEWKKSKSQNKYPEADIDFLFYLSNFFSLFRASMTKEFNSLLFALHKHKQNVIRNERTNALLIRIAPDAIVYVSVMFTLCLCPINFLSLCQRTTWLGQTQRSKAAIASFLICARTKKKTEPTKPENLSIACS